MAEPFGGGGIVATAELRRPAVEGDLSLCCCLGNSPMLPVTVVLEPGEQGFLRTGGRIVATLPPGRRTIFPADATLKPLIQAVPGGHRLGAEILVVPPTELPAHPFRVGVRDLADPLTGTHCDVAITGSYAVRVVDGLAFLRGPAGLAAAEGGHRVQDEVDGFLRRQLATIVTVLFAREEWSLLAVLDGTDSAAELSEAVAGILAANLLRWGLGFRLATPLQAAAAEETLAGLRSATAPLGAKGEVLEKHHLARGWAAAVLAGQDPGRYAEGESAAFRLLDDAKPEQPTMFSGKADRD